MCIPPDIGPRLPSSNQQNNGPPPNQAYQPGSWIPQQQEQWGTSDQQGWYDFLTVNMNTPQGHHLGRDSINCIPPVASLGLPMKNPPTESFSNSFGFVGSSVSQPFNQAPHAPWGGSTLKVPMQASNMWQANPIPPLSAPPLEAPMANAAPGYPSMLFSRKTLSQQQPSMDADTSLPKWSNTLNPSPKSDASKLASRVASWNNASPASFLDSLEDDQIEESPNLKNKKIKRMLSNRASAKRSRQRRQERLDELEIQSAKLHVEHAAMTRKLRDALETSRRFQEENSRLKREVSHLKYQLEENGSKKCKLMDSPGQELNDSSTDVKPLISQKFNPFPPANNCIDLSSDKEDVKVGSDPLSKAEVGNIDSHLDFSPFSPDSGVTASALDLEGNSSLPDFSSLPITSPDSIGNGLGTLEDDWFADLVDCFDDKPLVT